jgi:hypothetical protein
LKESKKREKLTYKESRQTKTENVKQRGGFTNKTRTSGRYEKTLELEMTMVTKFKKREQKRKVSG